MSVRVGSDVCSELEVTVEADDVNDGLGDSICGASSEDEAGDALSMISGDKDLLD
jgi:hypothetical protein